MPDLILVALLGLAARAAEARQPGFGRTVDRGSHPPLSL